MSVILVTGATSGIGALSAGALASKGHTVYAAMGDPAGRDAVHAAAAAAYAAGQGVDLRTVELDRFSQDSADSAIAAIVRAHKTLDVVVHHAEHVVIGPTEAFTADQLANVYDSNVLGTQRVNRAALPHLRAQGSGLLLWIASTGTHGGAPPYLAPYFAAKAAMEALAVSYAAELARFNIETTIVMSQAYTRTTEHVVSGQHPADEEAAEAYELHYAGLADDMAELLADLASNDADMTEVAEAIVEVVDIPHGRRPFRVHIDPSQDGAEEASAVADRVRAEFLALIGLSDLLTPHTPPS